jgi:hypothetical protein
VPRASRSLESRNSGLLELNLSVNDLSDPYGESLGLAVSRNGTLTALNLSTNRLGARSSQAFARVLQSHKSALKHLNLVNNKLGQAGGITLSQTIEEQTRMGDEAIGLLGRKGTLPRLTLHTSPLHTSPLHTFPLHTSPLRTSPLVA